MATENLADLSADKLRKRKKFASLILGVMIGLLSVNIIIFIFKGNITLVATSLALLVTGFPMFMGLKKIKAELKRRENQ